MKYYKGLDENFCGMNDYQYEVGKAFTADTDNTWHWLYFAGRATDALRYGPRIAEVEPLTEANQFGSKADMNARSIRIVRELSRDEIIDTLVEEKCPFFLMGKVEPSYEQLMRHKNHIQRFDYKFIVLWEWLTADEKKKLLPKTWDSTIKMQEG